MLQAYCPDCKKESEMLSIKEVIYAARICRRTVYDWIRRGRLHLMEDAGGHTLICKRSLIGPYTKSPLSSQSRLMQSKPE